MMPSRREWLAGVAAALGAAAHAALQAGALRQAGKVDAANPSSWTIAEIRRRLDNGDVSPSELVEAYLGRIARLNADLNAYVTVTSDRAREEARRLTAEWARTRRGSARDSRGARRSAALGVRPLLGVPLAHKDLLETAGIRTTAGSKLYEEHVPKADAALVAALAAAGAVTLGKTNTHELGGGVTTINPFYGATRNPHDRSRIPGGSSGGSAAAVAAHLCAAATGSDTGGSIRIPAALCGCVGFKPTFGLLSTKGLLGVSPTFDHVGLLARTVEDVGILFDTARAARISRAGTGGPVEARDDRAVRTPLRVGIARRFFFDGLEADVARAVEDTLARLRAAGAAVRDRVLPIDERTMARVFDPIVIAEIWQALGPEWRRRPDHFSPGFATFFETPMPDVRDVVAAHEARRRFQVEVQRAFEDVDVVVMPTVPATAPPIDGPIDGMRLLRNTWPFNAARAPALSVPCGMDRQGLPIGLQIVGRAGADSTVLRAGWTVERGG